MTATRQMPPTRVVLVDDHPLFRRGLGELLSEGGQFDVVADFDDGTDLLEALSALAPDLVIVDWQMPNIDGLTLMRHLKQRDPSLKVVLLTASDDSRHLLDAIQQGADGYLLKDTAPERILERLQAVVDGKLGLEEDTMLQLARRLQQDHRHRLREEHPESQTMPQEMASQKMLPQEVQQKMQWQQTPAPHAASPVEVLPSDDAAAPPAESHAMSVLPGTAVTGPAAPDWHAGLTERERDTLKWIGRGLSNKLIARELGISDSTVKVYVKNLLRKLHLHSRLELAAWVYAHPLNPSDTPRHPLADPQTHVEKESLR